LLTLECIDLDTMICCAAGVANTELARCFFRWNGTDVTAVTGAMQAKDPSLKNMSAETIMNSKPLSFWTNKVRRVYYPAQKQVDNLTKVRSSTKQHAWWHVNKQQ
jgi:hypothetical protein